MERRLSSYYYALFLLPALLAVIAPPFELAALAAVCASRVVNAIPFIYDNGDVRYLAQSAVFLAWAATVPVLLLWYASRKGRNPPCELVTANQP